MGSGRCIACKKCGYRFDEISGIGFLYPNVVADAVKDGKAGKLGKEVEEFFQKYPDGTLNCESTGYVCTKCGALKSDNKYTMYAPKPDAVDIPKCCLPDELHIWYRFYKRYPHKCDVCQGNMKILTDTMAPICPVCGIPMDEELSSICWD